MGLLSKGTPLPWKEAKQYADHIREHGIKQLINIFHRLKDRQNDKLLWGDEIEYILVKFDEKERKVQLCVRAKDLLAKLEAHAEEVNKDGKNHVLWHPEYAGFQLESTPSLPYGGLLRDLVEVQANMEERRRQVQLFLGPDEALLSVTNFPRLGCKDFCYPPMQPSPLGDISRSIFFPDEAINTHPRFPTLTANIRRRRGSNTCVNLPIYRDVNTPNPFIEDLGALDPTGESASQAKPDHVYMDAMGFGMGCCCLQLTFQACSIDEARHLYDQLAIVAPIILSISACSPVWRGYLTDRDCRWDVISAAVDDRTPAERGLPSDTPSRYVIAKSRYDSISSFIGKSDMFDPKYNDIELEIDEKICATLQENGFDSTLARHFAHLYIRDPIVVYKELLEQDDAATSDHFENIQSTNWQTMRFKPPPPGSPIGWRVEFRPTEVQLTDFENAAYVVFIVLLTRTILSFGLNFYMPISKVDENLRVAQQRDAARQGKFLFRKYIGGCFAKPADGESCDVYEPMSANDIINGKEGFLGLIPAIKMYLKTLDVDLEIRLKIDNYLALISKRASGELMTAARWMRDFINNHPEYKQDSVVSDAITHDLLREISSLSKEGATCEKLLGQLRR